VSAAVVVLLALAADLATGDPPNRWHPVAWIGVLLGRGRARLARGSPARLLAGGALLTLVAAALAAAAGAGIAALAAHLGAAGLALEALALKATVSVRGLARAAGQVAEALEGGDLAGARALVGVHLVSRPTGALDEGAVASAAVESVAENLTDALLAPLVLYLVLGLPGAAAYRAVNTADAMIGYRDGDLEHFGKAAARLDDLLNLVPARLAAAALVIAAALGGGDARRALVAAWREHGRTASPNAGWTMAAMAGALGVVLEKPAHYRLGHGRPPTAADIRRAVRLLWTAVFLVVVTTVLVDVIGICLGFVNK
jgi:adenosylcobinamide-phosphate synthase